MRMAQIFRAEEAGVLGLQQLNIAQGLWSFFAFISVSAAACSLISSEKSGTFHGTRWEELPSSIL